MKQKVVPPFRGHYNIGMLALASITLFHKVMEFLFFLIIFNVDTIAGPLPSAPPPRRCPPLPFTTWGMHIWSLAHPSAFFIQSPPPPPLRYSHGI